MSDRKNRDIGNKRAYKKIKSYCSCWYCQPGACKKKVKSERVTKNEINRARQGNNDE